MSLNPGGMATEDSLREIVDYGVVNMEMLHSKVHKGELFFISSRIQASSTQRVYLIRTSAKSLHMRIFLSASGASPSDLLKNVTVTSAGTEKPSFNYNEVSSNVALTKFYTGTTFTGGTVYRENQAGFGTTPGAARSGETVTSIEYIVPPSSDRILRITPSTTVDTVVIIDFYEV